MHNSLRRALVALLVLVLGALVLPLGASATAQDTSGDAPRVRLARATWDTGWFQAEVYRLLLERLGYQVDGPTTMDNAEFYGAVAEGEVDLWVNGWFPSHHVFIPDGSPVSVVGTAVDDGALQGYFVDAATAVAHGISNLGDLSDPAIAELFDHDGDGVADLVGCNVGWSCASIIDHHLEAYGLTGTVEHVQGDYSPLIAETIDRFRDGQPVLYFTWTPNWTAGELVPGQDVVWLETPFPSLPADLASSIDYTTIAGIPGCANDPCQTGWPPNDIRAVANTDFLSANPSVGRLLEQVVIPLTDISAQNVRMVTTGGDPADIRRHAEEWVAANQATVERWIAAADPDAVGISEPSGEEAGPGGTLTVAARALPPFVIYENRIYSGFEVELVRLAAAKLGMGVEIYAVDTTAKQIDDIDRGVARLGLGGVAVTESREEVVDFSLPVLDSGLTILVPNDSSRGIGDRIASFFRAVWSSDLPWLMIVFAAAVLVAAHLIWLSERRHNPDFAVPYRRGIWDSFYWSVVTMSTVGYGDKVARGTRGRVLALLWIALGTLVFASFTAAIASSLAVSELRSEISGPSDLAGKRVATATHSAAETYLPSIGVGPVLVGNIDDAYPLLLDGEVDAVVFDAPVLQFHAAREGDGEVTTVGSDFQRVQYGFMLSPDDPELREHINLALLDLVESGIYERLHDTWFGPQR
ncbi:glycine betaine/L-proline ABC transporter substrate-binding protein ProX [Candidatus Poriferisocius sp.]|uniref:glycine betaine/L-proline ABC transporter substrate-binding protein ProX n=1 Tax=Candidatus Poriferisocius sp. TaxID=3101276 RepID=UPI003B59835A